MNGKGSKPRPLSVTKDRFNENWERTFGRKQEQPPKQEKPKFWEDAVIKDTGAEYTSLGCTE